MALQIAVLSTSRIVAEVMREIGNWPEVEVTAIICRPQSAEKAHAWAAEYGVSAVYTDEAAAYAAGGFDAVYMCCWKSPLPPQRPRRGSCLPWRTPRGWC